MKNTEYSFPEPDRASYKPLYVQISELIIDYTEKMRLGPGNILPSENELLSKFNVSRNTVRQAIERLVSMNFAVKVKGQGTFIKEKEKSAIGLLIPHGIEEALTKIGITLKNRLVEKRVLNNKLFWMNDLDNIKSDRNILIRRLKLSDGKPLALEDRILPFHVVERYSDEELERENIYPYLLEKYPDTTIKHFKYSFSCYKTNQTEARLLKRKEGTAFLQRLGEYYNSTGECFMVSRIVFIEDRIRPSFRFENKKDFVIVK